MADKPNTSAKAETKKLTFAELAALKVGEPAAYLKKIVVMTHAMEKAKDAFVGKLQFHAKVVAALKRAYVERLNSREIPPDTTFKQYFEQNAGGTLPGRVETLATLFNSLVLTLDANGKPLLSEECFDNAAVDWLEKANAIIKQAQRQHGENWKTSDEVLDTINALSKPGDALKAIKEIRARQKGEQPEGDETGASAQPLTVGRAIEFLKSTIANGGNTVAAGKANEVYDLFVETTLNLPDCWESSGIKVETLNAWSDKAQKATCIGVAPHLEVLTPEPDDTATEPAEAALAS